MELLILLVLILINGLFAMSEIAVVSARKARLQQYVNAGSSSAALALQLSGDPGRMLSTVQVGITTIGILSGAFGENAIAERLITVFNEYPAIAPYSQLMATVIMVAVITYFSVVLGELVPKQLALLAPERIASIVARPMHVLSKIAHPLVALFSFSSNALLRLIGAKRDETPAVTEEEIKVMLQQGAEAGVFEPTEPTMVGNVFRLDDVRVATIMTPRHDIYFLDLENSDEENRGILAEGRFQTLPVCRGGLDHLVGLLDTKDFLGRILKGEQPNIADVSHPALFVSASVTPNQLLETLRRHRAYVALAVDEYGEIAGLVTLTDLLEAIIGDLPDVEQEGSDDAVRREDGSWLLDGMLPFDRVVALFKLPDSANERRGHSHTLGGFVMDQIGHVPAVGRRFEYEGLSFEVVDMDRNRVDRVLVDRIDKKNPPHP